MYSTYIYSFDPVSGLLVPAAITWFDAPTGAMQPNLHHQYASANWTRGIAYPDQVGEILADPRPWSAGATPAGLVGTNYCGADGLWLGKMDRLTTPIPDNSYGQPSCCSVPLAGCVHCVGGVSRPTYRLQISGGTGDFALFNGVWTLPQYLSCTWNYLDSAREITWTVAAGGQVATLQGIGTPHIAAYNNLTPWDCQSPRSTSLVFSTGAGLPPSVSLLFP
jgi:hypothetical protein